MIKKMILILFSLFFISCNNQNINQLYADWGFFNLEQNMISELNIQMMMEVYINMRELIILDNILM